MSLNPTNAGTRKSLDECFREMSTLTNDADAEALASYIRTHYTIGEIAGTLDISEAQVRRLMGR